MLFSVGILLSVYFVTLDEIEEQIEKELFHELQLLEDHYNADGLTSLTELIKQRDKFGHHLHHYYTLLKEHGEFITGNSILARNTDSAAYQKYGVTFYEFSEYIMDDGHDVIVRFAQKQLPNKMFILAGQAQISLTELREHTLHALIYAVLITIILALVIGTYMGKTVLNRIQRIDRGLETAINTDFKQNLEIPENEDEFQALTLKLNVTLFRIEQLLEGMRQVTNNIAHDLRSPLTRMISRLDVTLLKDRDDIEYRKTLEHTVNECNALLETFNTLLSIAQAESGISREQIEEIDLATIADELADLYQAVAEEKEIDFRWIKSGSAMVRCSRQALAQAISNLLENSIKYTPAGGYVEISIGSTPGLCSIIVKDSGPGIPEVDRDRVLERFQRLDAARSKPGNGLGLSMVNAIAKLCNAELILSDNKPGLIVELCFPDCTH